VNALARNRGLQQFRVRGLQRVKSVVLLFALAQNMAREQSLTKKNTDGIDLPKGSCEPPKHPPFLIERTDD